MPRRYFTLEQANSALPLVKRVVADLTERYPKWRDLVYRYEMVAAQARPEWGESTEQVALRAQIEDVAREINGYLNELDQIGCVFKGFDLGLVDFYGQMDGRDILWCWKQGESSIRYWHEIEAGYAGRRRITADVRDWGLGTRD